MTNFSAGSPDRWFVRPSVTILTGDILADDAAGIVIPVNSRGVMGAGLARQARELWPDVELAYQRHCRGGFPPGSIWSVPIEDDQLGHRRCWLVTTKDHWRDPSRIEWVEQICQRLAAFYREFSDESVAIPALGSGLGKLPWSWVRPMMERTFTGLDARIYSPHNP